MIGTDRIRRTAAGLAVSSGLALLALAAGVGAAQKATPLTATMTPAQVVTPKHRPWKVPAGAKSARGTFSGTLSADGHRLKWRITYKSVSGRVTAEVRAGARGRYGVLLGRLCSRCRSGQRGTATFKRGYRSQFRLGSTFVTLTTPKYPKGVVRGQIRPR